MNSTRTQASRFKFLFLLIKGRDVMINLNRSFHQKSKQTRNKQTRMKKVKKVKTKKTAMSDNYAQEQCVSPHKTALCPRTHHSQPKCENAPEHITSRKFKSSVIQYSKYKKSLQVRPLQQKIQICSYIISCRTLSENFTILHRSAQINLDSSKPRKKKIPQASNGL